MDNHLREDKIPTVVRNEWFYLFSRICMVLGTTIGIPFCGFMMSRVVTKADEIAAIQQEQTIQLRVISAEVKLRFENDGRNIGDHELRLRALERK